MKLYFSPGACSMAPHILLNELGLKFEPVQVDLKAKKLADGGDYTKINPKGSVPALELDNGEVLTENAVIHSYLIDQKPDGQPVAGTMERYRMMEWLNFIATDLHKGCSPFFNPKTPDEYKTIARETLTKKLD